MKIGNEDRDDRQDRAETDPRRQAHELSNEGARLITAGRPQEAIPLLRAAQELVPDDVSVAINLGAAYVLIGKHRLAVPFLERACQLEPHNVMAWTNLGAAYLDRPPYDTPEGEEKAIQAFERALKIDPAAPNVSYNLGLIRRDREEWELALRHFQDAHAADPQDRDAQRWCAVLAARLREQTQAEPSSDVEADAAP